MSSSGEFMERLYKIMADQLQDIEPVFEVQCSIHKFPVHLSGLGNPGFPFFIIHGGDDSIHT